MMEDVKLGFKLVSLSYGKKMMIISGGIMMVLGIAYSLFLHHDLGGYFIGCAAMMATQQVFSVLVSGMVASSPIKKQIQTRLVATMNTFCMLLIYIIFVIIELINVLLRPNQLVQIGENVIMTVVFMLILMLYMSVAFKAFEIGTLLFVVFVAPLIFLSSLDKIGIPVEINSLKGLILLMLLGAGMIVSMGFLSYYIFKRMYKYPISKNSMNVMLRKDM